MTDPVPVLWALRNRWRGRVDGSPPPPACKRCNSGRPADCRFEHVHVCVECLGELFDAVVALEAARAA